MRPQNMYLAFSSFLSCHSFLILFKSGQHSCNRRVLKTVHTLWGSYRYSLSTYFPFCYSLWAIRIFSM